MHIPWTLFAVFLYTNDNVADRPEERNQDEKARVVSKKLNVKPLSRRGMTLCADYGIW